MVDRPSTGSLDSAGRPVGGEQAAMSSDEQGGDRVVSVPLGERSYEIRIVGGGAGGFGRYARERSTRPGPVAAAGRRWS